MAIFYPKRDKKGTICQMCWQHKEQTTQKAKWKFYSDTW